MTEISILKYISSQTELSRRAIFALLINEKISKNDKIITSTKTKVTKNDIIKINNKIIKPISKIVYYKFYKPKDIISTFKDPKNRKDLSLYQNKIEIGCFPIGRLDRQTKGLLLFTNDGEFANTISHPKFHIEKVYKVTLNKNITNKSVSELNNTIELDDGPVKLNWNRQLDKHSILVSISEGRNRIIRRLFDNLGYTVKKLKRISIGNIELGSLKEGEFKKLTKSELKNIKKLIINKNMEVDT